MTISHDEYMQQALALAAKGRFTVSPNPMVGCVIVKNNRIVAEGWHQKTGEAHAEIHALNQAGEKAKGATIYVTLEPCCHFGKTPPCVDALIQAQIGEIYIAVKDPNHLVAGKGIERLMQAGIKVHVGICQKEAAELNAIFFHYIKYQRPFVIAKWAISLDGKTTAHANDTRQISGIAAQQHTHDLRQQVDAILIGSRTAEKDNPQLTVRLGETISRHPLRIVLTRQGLLPLNLKIFDNTMPGKTLVVTTAQSALEWRSQLAAQKIEIAILPLNEEGYIDLHVLLKKLAERQISSLLIEGGMETHQHFLAEKLVNQLEVYVSPTIIGSTTRKQALKKLSVNTLGNDFHFSTSLLGE